MSEEPMEQNWVLLFNLALCWHEAGHAVANEVLDLGQAGAAVELFDANPDSVGRGEAYRTLPKSRQPSMQLRILTRAIISQTISGLWGTGDKHFYKEATCNSDTSRASELGHAVIVSRYPNKSGVWVDRKCERLIDRLEAKARRLVKKHEYAIELVARVLYRTHRLNGPQVRFLLEVAAKSEKIEPRFLYWAFIDSILDSEDWRQLETVDTRKH